MKQEKWNTAKPVYQYTLDGMFLHKWDSVQKAAEVYAKGIGGHISQCAALKRSNAYGFRWLYEKDTDRAEEIFRSLPIRKWKKEGYTVEEILEKASGCESLQKFYSDKETTLYYHAASRMGIVDLLPFKRLPDPYKDKLYFPYVYEFPETHSAYIGITCRKQRRDKDHRNGNKKRVSIVRKHADEFGIEIPPVKYLSEEGYYATEAGRIEDYWKKVYLQNGWNILNKAKTGKNSSSLGKASKKYSKKEIIEAAAGCEDRGDFLKKYPKLFHAASDKGILQEVYEITGLKKKKPKMRKYSEKEAYDVAKQYSRSTDLKKADINLYSATVRYGWIKQYWWFRYNGTPDIPDFENRIIA